MLIEGERQFQVQGGVWVGRHPRRPLRVAFRCQCYHCGQLKLDLGQALEIIRGCQGLNVVGCDLVEVSPPYDPSGE